MHVKRYVLSLRLNVEMLSLRRIESGSEFHTLGAATAKARLAVSVRVRGTYSRGAIDDLRVRLVSYGCSNEAKYSGVAVV